MITVTRHFRSHVLPQQILLIAKKDSVLASHGNSRNNINFGIEEVSLLPYSQDSTCRKWILQWRRWWSTTTAALTTETQSSSFAWDVQNHEGVSRHADAGAPPASTSPRVHLRQHGPPGGEAGVRVVQHIHGDGDAWAPIVREGAKRTRGRWGRARSGRPARTKPRRLNRSSSPSPPAAQRSLHRPSPHGRAGLPHRRQPRGASKPMRDPTRGRGWPRGAVTRRLRQSGAGRRLPSSPPFGEGCGPGRCDHWPRRAGQTRRRDSDGGAWIQEMVAHRWEMGAGAAAVGGASAAGGARWGWAGGAGGGGGTEVEMGSRRKVVRAGLSFSLFSSRRKKTWKVWVVPD